MNDVLIERLHHTPPRKTGVPHLDKIEAKQAWRLAHKDEDEEFRTLVLKFYDEIRTQQITADAKEEAQRLADIRRKAQKPRKPAQKTE